MATPIHLHLIVGLTLLSSLPASLSSGSSRNIDPVLQGKIDDFIKDVYLPATGLTSLGMAMVKDDGEILYTTGFGYADQEEGILIGNGTAFSIGSITKSFTATAAVKSIVQHFSELGEDALDTPLLKLFPQANLTFIDRFRSEHMTMRDLLAHRACLFRHDLPLGSEPFETLEELTYRSRYSEEICGIRSEMQYNNIMYTIAGQLLATLWNKDYDDMMQDLFTDLGMDSTAIAKRSDDFSQLARAKPYYVMDNVSYPMNVDLMMRIVPYRPAGGIWATPNDMARYMRFHLNFGSLDGKQIVPEEAIRWMTKPSVSFQVPPAYKESEDEIPVIYQGAGLGLALLSYDGWQYVQHGGTFTPYTSFMSLFPAQKLGIFTSTNQSPNLIFDDVLHYFIFETLRGNPNAAKMATALLIKSMEKKALGLRKKTETVQKMVNKGPKRNAEEIIGQYGNGAAGDIDIYEKWNDVTNTTGVYFSYGKWMLGWVENVGDDFYKVSWDTDIVQHLYAVGDREGASYIQVANEVVDFLQPEADGSTGSAGRFRLGVNLANLPPIPWNPGSCGVE